MPLSRQGGDTGAQRTAPGMANTFARPGMSITCLVISKVRLFAVNYRQTWARCEWLKNKGVATKLSADPLDKRMSGGKTCTVWPGFRVGGEAADWRGEDGFLTVTRVRKRGCEKTPEAAEMSGNRRAKRGQKLGAERAQKRRKKDRKGAKEVVFGSFLRVFSTRLFGKYADGKEVKLYLHQTKCSFF
jgi:hypothetical protein